MVSVMRYEPREREGRVRDLWNLCCVSEDTTCPGDNRKGEITYHDMVGSGMQIFGLVQITRWRGGVAGNA
jgi:hypothetical protein